MAAGAVWRFGAFWLDVSNAQLWKEEQTLSLKPKALAMLRYLIEHAGQLVTKEALFQAVWPDTVVSEAVLTTCMREIRQVLGDEAKAPQFVETVHRRGYRFIAAVMEQMNEPVVYFERTEDPPGPLPLLFSPALPEEEHPARLSPSFPSPALAGEGRGEGLAQPSSNDNQLPLQLSAQRPWLRASLWLAGLFLLAGLVVTVQYLSLRPPTPFATIPPEQPPTLPLPDKPSIAVLPLVNLSGDPEQEYFSDGMTEELITGLSRLSGLFVIARSSVFTYKGKAVKVEEVSRELGVRYVLEGSVRKADNKVRITAELVDATTGHQLWAEHYDRPLQDIFTLQDEITQQIATALRAEVLEAEQKRIRRIPTENLNAYEMLLRGREYWSRFTKEANTQARQMYEKAIELDPQYAAAYAALGFTYLVEWALQWSQDPQSLERAAELAQKAITLDDSLPGAHRLLGAVSLWKNRQHDLAIAEGERALALDPNNAEGYAALANILTFAGRPKEAIGLLEKGMRLNPRGPNYAFYLFELGHAYHWLEQYEKAIATQQKVLTLNPRNFVAHLELAVMYNELGREEEARAEVAAALELNPQYSLEDVKERHPYKDPAALERTLAGLRKAGLK